jgi:deoxyribonuclease V
MNQRIDINPKFLYPESLDEAILIQKKLAEQISAEDDFDPPNFFGGMDVSNNLFDPKQMIYATSLILDAKTLSVIEHKSAFEKQEFPYITGFLGFREAPALIHALQSLSQKPDLLFVDGQGIAHPRGLGIASHIGVLANIPTIGVAKTILVGKPQKELGSQVGDYVFLFAKEKKVGVLLRTKRNCKPLVISIGHRISLSTAIEYVLKCSKGYRLPEPTRQAHLAANNFRKMMMD